MQQYWVEGFVYSEQIVILAFIVRYSLISMYLWYVLGQLYHQLPLFKCPLVFKQLIKCFQLCFWLRIRIGAV